MNPLYIIIGIGTLFLLLTWMAFIDIVRKDFGSMEKKLIWGVVAFIPFIGVTLYLIFGFRKGKVKA
jgi:hypothetical protein